MTGYDRCIRSMAAAGIMMAFGIAAMTATSSAKSWGVPANGFIDDFEDGSTGDLNVNGFAISSRAIAGTRSLECRTSGTAYYPSAYLRSVTDSVPAGWQRISQGGISAVIVGDSSQTRPGVGFIAPNGAAVFAMLDFANQRLNICRRNSTGRDTVLSSVSSMVSIGYENKLEVLWSPFANTLLAIVYNANGYIEVSLRAVMALPEARYPALFCSGGTARFDDVDFDPALDSWNYDWEFYTSSILTPQAVTGLSGATNFANGVHWKWKDNKFYLRMRNGRTYSSTNVLNWTLVGTSPIWCPSDPCNLVDPFGDGYVYISSRAFPWLRNNGSDGFVKWDTVTSLGLNTHGLQGALQDIIDVKKYPGKLDSIAFGGSKYRFIGVGEYTFAPFSTVILSNNLHNWVRPDTVNPVPARFQGYDWQEMGDAIGCAWPMADGNILIISCTCTAAGYTGTGYDATGVTAVINGKQPWITLKVSRLPMTPALDTSWIKGPNMPNSFVYDSANDILYFFSDFGDQRQGVLRVRNYSQQMTGVIKGEPFRKTGYTPPRASPLCAIDYTVRNIDFSDRFTVLNPVNVFNLQGRLLYRGFINTRTLFENKKADGFYMVKPLKN